MHTCHMRHLRIPAILGIYPRLAPAPCTHAMHPSHAPKPCTLAMHLSHAPFRRRARSARHDTHIGRRAPRIHNRGTARQHTHSQHTHPQACLVRHTGQAHAQARPAPPATRTHAPCVTLHTHPQWQRAAKPKHYCSSHGASTTRASVCRTFSAFQCSFSSWQ